MKSTPLIDDNEQWLHTPKAKRALTEAFAWLAATPARVSDLSVFRKIITEQDSAAAKILTNP